MLPGLISSTALLLTIKENQTSSSPLTQTHLFPSLDFDASGPRPRPTSYALLLPTQVFSP